jgi:hypothetical protein
MMGLGRCALTIFSVTYWNIEGRLEWLCNCVATAAEVPILPKPPLIEINGLGGNLASITTVISDS